jgi:hypothetical protein
MLDPQSPAVQKDVEKYNRRARRINSPGARFLLYAGALLLGIGIGLFAHFIGQAASPFGQVLPPPRRGVSGDLEGLVRALGWMLVFFIPQFIGWILGELIARLARKAMVFRRVTIKHAAILSGVVAYTLHQALSVAAYGMIRELTQWLSIGFELAAPTWWLYLLVAWEAVALPFTAQTSAIGPPVLFKTRPKKKSMRQATFTPPQPTKEQMERALGLKPGTTARMNSSQPSKEGPQSERESDRSDA